MNVPKLQQTDVAYQKKFQIRIPMIDNRLSKSTSFPVHVNMWLRNAITAAY